MQQLGACCPDPCLGPHAIFLALPDTGSSAQHDGPLGYCQRQCSTLLSDVTMCHLLALDPCPGWAAHDT